MRNTLDEIGIWKRHRSGCRRARILYSGRVGLKLNIGCGRNYKDGWVNIDLAGDPDLILDMRQSIPLPDGSASLIYSEHFFEHLDYPHDALQFLSESYRILEEGGIFSVGVPDTEWPLLDYAGVGDGKYWEATKVWRPEWVKTRLDDINYHFRQDGEHRYAYDLETLRSAIQTVGFTDVKRRDFDPNFDTEARRVGTLYVEAVKPALDGEAKQVGQFRRRWEGIPDRSKVPSPTAAARDRPVSNYSTVPRSAIFGQRKRRCDLGLMSIPT